MDSSLMLFTINKGEEEKMKNSMKCKFILFFVAFSRHIQTSHFTTIPEECKEGNYMDLNGSNNQHRFIDYTVDYTYEPLNSHDKTKKFDFQWFRFNSAKSTRMLERNDVSDLVMKEKEKVKPCGTEIYPVTKPYFDKTFGFGFVSVHITSLFFVLNDFHPVKKYGLIYTSSIGCQYSYHSTGSPQYACDLSGFICNLTLTCHPQSATPLIVRNCGDFYVYKSQPLPPYNGLSLQSAFGGRSVTPKDGLFCGTSSKLERDSVLPQCLKEIYHVVDEKDRMWDFESSYEILEERNKAGICYDDSTFLQNKWIRFESGNSDEKLRLAENCPSLIEDLSSLSNKTFCQAFYRGWIQGKHPSVLEGRVTRTLCFSRPSTCKCELSSEITVTNCGDFFVYRRRSRDFPHCLARACTVPYTKDEKDKLTIMITSSPSPIPRRTLSSNEPAFASLSSTLHTPSSSTISSPAFASLSSTLHTPSSPTISSVIHPSSSLSSYLPISTSESITTTPIDINNKHQTSPTLCKDYKTIVDEERRSRFKIYGKTTCELKYQSAVRFMSKDNVNLQLKEGCRLIDQFTRTCSSFNVNVWINRSHPTVPGSIHIMQVCIKASNSDKFFDEDYCRCERKEVFFVELCTGDREEDLFYVYRLFPLFKSKGNKQDSKECILKYCTNLQRSSTLR